MERSFLYVLTTRSNDAERRVEREGGMVITHDPHCNSKTPHPRRVDFLQRGTGAFPHATASSR